jgi:hypothetical protein
VLQRHQGDVVGTAGFNVPAYNGVAQLKVQARPSSGPVRLDVRSEGAAIRSMPLDAQEHSISWLWPDRGLAFVEVHGVDVDTGAPARLHVTVTSR